MNIIHTHPVTVPHCLRIFTLNQVPSFALVDGMAILSLPSEAYVDGQDAVPGSLDVSDTPGDTNIYQKTYSFRLRGVTAKRTWALTSLKMQGCIMEYIDESGNKRIGGSRDWPLYFSFHIADGAYHCILTGQGTEQDPFLI